jgi:hypothetical protein
MQRFTSGLASAFAMLLQAACHAPEHVPVRIRLQPRHLELNVVSVSSRKPISMATTSLAVRRVQ